MSIKKNCLREICRQNVNYIPSIKRMTRISFLALVIDNSILILEEKYLLGDFFLVDI